MLKNAELVMTIPVKNMQRALQFYHRTLGLEQYGPKRGPLKELWAELRTRSEHVWLGAGVWQATFIVKDIRAEISELQKKNVKFKRVTTRMGGKKISDVILELPSGRVAFWSDSERNALMLFQPASKKSKRTTRRTTRRKRVRV